MKMNKNLIKDIRSLEKTNKSENCRKLKNAYALVEAGLAVASAHKEAGLLFNVDFSFKK